MLILRFDQVSVKLKSKLEAVKINSELDIVVVDKNKLNCRIAGHFKAIQPYNRSHVQRWPLNPEFLHFLLLVPHFSEVWKCGIV